MREDWIEVELGGISHSIQYGYTESSSDKPIGPKFLRITDIQDNSVDWNNVPYCKISDEKLGNYLLKKGDLLFARTGATVGKSFLIRNDIPQSVFASYLIRVRVNNIILNEIFLSYYFYSPFYWKQITDGQVGIGQPNVNGTKLGKLKILLAPLPIQRAIVLKIENLFASLDKGIADLKIAQQQLKVYRQAVLKKAFEGKLTNSLNRDSSDLPDDYDLPMVAESAAKYNSQGNRGDQRNQGLNNLPKGWKWVKVEDSAEKIIDCLHSTPKFQNKGKYCIDTTCITNGAILWNKVRYVAEESFIERISRLKPQLGDVIFSREGTVGTTVVLNKDEDVCLGQRMMMFRLKDEMYSKYFMYYFQSDAFIMQYKPLIGGTTSPHLNIRDIKRLIVPICSIPEQHAIVREIESRLSVCDKVEQNIGEALEKAEALRQSILKKAFEGKLLSEAEIAKCKQEADYEPASVLLARIKKEKHGK